MKLPKILCHGKNIMNIISEKAKSKVNHKKALIFIARKKWFKPIYIGKTKSFTGYQTIGSFYALGKESFDIQFSINKGSCALIIVQDQRYHIISDQTTKKTYSINLDPGRARLRIIGEKADVQYTIVRHIE
jgi:hypothetical protein